MSWECGCGVINRDSKPKCGACGTPKGMVWTSHGFRTPEEAAALAVAMGDIRHERGSLWEVFLILAWILTFFYSIYRVVGDKPSKGWVLFAWTIVIAAYNREAWGWYFLLIVFAFLSLFSIILGVAAIVDGQWLGIVFIALALLSLAWFIYFYKRRVMFGAKGRWKWFERTFPRFVGSEEETSVKEEPKYLNKWCPRCAEQIYLEESNCRYCDYQFAAEELVAVIAQILDKHKDEFASLIDFTSATKQCPACLQSIKLEALICRYCRHEFTNVAVHIWKVKALREKLHRIT